MQLVVKQDLPRVPAKRKLRQQPVKRKRHRNQPRIRLKKIKNEAMVIRKISL